MTSIYELFAKDCAEIAPKTKLKSDKAHLLRLAKQWTAACSFGEAVRG
jgi:hypothetical protein